MKKRVLLPSLLFLLLNSCKRDDDRIPDVLVDISVNINNPGYFQLQAIGGWMYFDGGSRGILVYRRSHDEFMAYDRHCPWEPGNPCGRVAVDSSSNIIARDACCGSAFVITDGSVSQGPATRPLKQYLVYYDGMSMLRIYN
jgi:nitrite reductase/ring-hydroxylating ferredoxin subunit